MANPLRLGILLSGGGRTLENILEHIRAGKLAAEVAVTIASRPNIRGIEISRAAGIPTHLMRPRDYTTVEAYSDAMVKALDEARVDLVCLAGFLSYWIIPERYLGRVMNIHPALLPAFGGKGMYGHHVHEAVIGADARSPAARSISSTTSTTPGRSSSSGPSPCTPRTRPTTWPRACLNRSASPSRKGSGCTRKDA